MMGGTNQTQQASCIRQVGQTAVFYSEEGWLQNRPVFIPRIGEAPDFGRTSSVLIFVRWLSRSGYKNFGDRTGR